MATPCFLFIHPLLGKDDVWSAYLVETATQECVTNPLAALCEHPQLAGFDQRHTWFLPAHICTNTDAPIAERSVIVFPAKPAVEHAARVTYLEEQLRKASHKLGLVTHPEVKLPASGTWDYVLIDASLARTQSPYALIGLASRSTLVGQRIQSHADHAWLKANACSLSTTEYLSTRASDSQKADTTRVKMLELLSLIADDADNHALEEIFRQEAKLSYSLLRLVNSAAMAPRNPITSFSQAINLLGRRQLQRWLQLLVYADPNDGQHPNPLLQKAAARGRQMEILATRLVPTPEMEHLQDAAFMVGTFSLLNVLLSMATKEILMQLPLAEPVSAALAEHAGPLGQLLSAIEAAEARDLLLAERLLKALGIDSAHHLDAQLTAFSWAARIRPNN